MDNRFIRAEEVAAELDVSKTYAYKLIRQLNEELKAKGFLTNFCRVSNTVREAESETPCAPQAAFPAVRIASLTVSATSGGLWSVVAALSR